MASTTGSQPAPPGKFSRWIANHPRLTLCLLVLLALGPFLTKPFSIDDPLFLWAAKHIQTEPANPYNFDVNWYLDPMPMWQVTKNPPLACYYLAAAGSVLGWSEIALHLAMLLPALGAILGTYRLARHFCDRPLFAAITTLFTPVFLVSSTSVMCDTPMLAFWIWAIVLWVEGLPTQNFPRLFVSALLMTLAAYTKYFGVALIPLLAAYSVFAQRRPGRWLFYFLLPLAGMIFYQWLTFKLYGRGLFSDAGDYATHQSFRLSNLVTNLIALSFTGGCVALAAFLTPWLWRKRTLIILCSATTAFALAVFAGGTILGNGHIFTGTTPVLLGAQVIFWSIAGVTLLALSVADAWQHRDAPSALLALWIWGTFLFAGFVNWTVNGRSILPLAPAAAILIARRLSQNPTGKKTSPSTLWICSAATALLALMVARADFDFATAVKRAAQQTAANYAHGPGTLWFEGHWGWQYYLQESGAKIVSQRQPPPATGDFLAIPTYNTNLRRPNEQVAHLVSVFPANEPPSFAAFSADVGAGFYSSLAGPVPFAFGKIPPEMIHIYAAGPAPSQ